MKYRYLATTLGLFTSMVAPTFMAKKHTNVPSEGKTGQAIIYTWNPKEGCIGHQSILIRDTANPAAEPLYGSIWPIEDAAPMISAPVPVLFKLFGVRATLAPNLAADIEAEDNRQPNDIKIIDGLDYQAMKQELQAVKTTIDANHLGYQFFTNAPNLLYWLAKTFEITPSSAPQTTEPFSGVTIPVAPKPSDDDDTPLLPRRTANCTSLVDQVLVAGGYTKTLNVSPWHRTPLVQAARYAHIGAKTPDATVRDTLINLGKNLTAHTEDNSTVSHAPKFKM